MSPRKFNSDATSTPALFVTHRSHLGPGKGGVQICTEEYISSLKLAGFDLNVLPIDSDQSIFSRVSRRFLTNPFVRPIATKDISRLRQVSKGFPLIFINQGYLAGEVSNLVSATSPRPLLVILSHGCEVTDFLHFVRMRNELPLTGRVRPSASVSLGSILVSEAAARKGVDAAITISPFDADFERWLGVPHVLTVPRTVTANILDWAPASGRFGYVGTLDHTPNLEGLVRVLDRIKEQRTEGANVRIVGGPERIGQWLSQRYSSVQYLGRLDDEALIHEAKTWLAFLHPIFLSPRGASTKLAQPLAWGIPIITTPQGSRGYKWKEGGVTLVNSASEFLNAMLALESEGVRSHCREAVLRAAASTPTLEEVANHIRCFMSQLMDVRGRWD